MADLNLQADQKKSAVFSQAFANINQEYKEKDVLAKAQKLWLGYINLLGINLNPDLLKILSREESERGKLIPFFLVGNKLRLAVLEPENAQTKQMVSALKNQGYKINLNLCSAESLTFAQKIYQTEKFKPKTEVELSISEKEIQAYDAEIEDLAKYADKLTELQSDSLLNLINAAAVKTNSSDVHLQPEETQVLLRFRIDGILKTVFALPFKIYEALLKQIKYESHLKFNITNLPQDGQFYFKINSNKINVRVSTLPTEFGEMLVLRYLDSRRGLVPLEALGITGRNFTLLKEGITAATGMILVTWPTGSGKTTTLYSILNQLNSSEKKIITLEDPIEYHLPWISQSQVDEERGYNFITGLRSILRQDPNILMVGEIRDRETAETAAQAALTGHLLLSTLHTNSAVETIPRLINMGLKPFILAPALNLIVAQRLVRRLCQECRVLKDLANEEQQYLEKMVARLQVQGVFEGELPTQIYAPVGCKKCSQTGFNGQIALLEVLKVSDEIEKMILAGASSPEILKTALAEGMLTMEEDGVMKVLAGVTVLSEIGRVV